MSAELIIIIMGIAFLLIAIADNIKTLNLINTKLRIPLGILGVLLIIYGGYSYGSIVNFGQIEQAELGNKSKINLQIEKVQVISPVAGDSVDCRILTMGVYPDSHEKDIWVLLKPSNNKFYPQSDHTNTSYKRNGEWQVITRFGGDKGESYEIIIYEADAAASQYFSSTIEKWKELDYYPGLSDEEIPRSANEVDRITVSLKENCRGVF